LSTYSNVSGWSRFLDPSLESQWLESPHDSIISISGPKIGACSP
jgi:hypothetical protein